MVLLLNGQTLKRPEPEPHHVLGHLGFLMFDAVTWAQMARERALTIHARIEKLDAMIGAHLDHPNTPKARARKNDLTNEYLALQVAFLGHEEVIHTLWKQSDPDERSEEACDALLNVSTTDDTLPPLWHHPLGSQKGALMTCPMETTSLRFSTGAMMRKYRRR